ncbi:(2Fe-2S)-binding protein [Candidatus Sumerlaeota bacterium]|nr:(2Fe-2S)-binding protein [Candidatus Sumerlaeota bacterium]
MPFQITVDCEVNGERIIRTLPATMLLSEFLRQELGLTGTKLGCNKGSCGACTVLLDGKPVNSCLIFMPQVHKHTVVTIEGLGKEGELTDLQKAFIEEGAVQCGFCTPGMVIVSEFLLRKNPCPTEEEIRDGIAGNLCRCTGYTKIIRAIQKAAKCRAEH